MTRAEKKRIAELIDEGLGDTAIARSVNRSRTTIYRYRWTLQQERAHTAVEERVAEVQRDLVDQFVKSIGKLDLRAWLVGLAMLPNDARLAVLAVITSDIDVTPEELRQFNGWLKASSERVLAGAPGRPKAQREPPSPPGPEQPKSEGAD